MKKIKKFLSLIVLMVGCAVCLCSCSCSKNPGNPTSPSTGGETPPPDAIPNTYTVSVTLANGGGSYLSSTGNDVHAENSSPIYTITPNTGYAVQTITLDGETYFTHEVNGYNSDPVQVNLVNITSNHIIIVTFYQMDFFVDCVIDTEPYAVSDGGTIVSSTGGNQHKGATSPVYTITPKNGYCVYFLKVDNETIFNYVDAPERATQPFVLDSQFENISANHSITASFYILADVSSGLISGNYYTANDFLPDVMEDTSFNAVTAEIETYGDELVPDGMPQVVNLTINQYFNFEAFKITFDGVNYSTEISATQDYASPNGDFTYDATNKKFIFSNLAHTVNIKTYCRAKSVDVVLYNYDTKESETIRSNQLYSYFVVDNAFKDYHWYYSLSSNYAEYNVYKNTSITSTMVGANELYHFYLSDKMICSENDSIILIYSSSDLKN